MPVDDFSKNNIFSSASIAEEANLVPITREIIKKLKSEQRRTGLTGYALMKLQDDPPKGLTGNIVNAMFDAHSGPVQRTPEHFLAFVFEAYKKLPDTPRRWRSEKENGGYIPVTDEFRQLILNEVKRTGVKVNTLLTKAARTQETKAKPQAVYSWLNDKTVEADREAMEELEQLYAALPTKKDISVRNEGRNTSLCKIREADRKKLQLYKDVLGILPNFIFKKARDVPEGLPRASVNGWIDGSRKKANPEYIRWVLNRCRELVREASYIDRN